MNKRGMATDELKVFYSWQDTLPSNTNRNFILDVLERAAKAVRADESVSVDPVIDRDTQGEAGSPNIVQTILEKIEASALFVADISLAGTLANGKQTPNPNVLFELGYALSAKNRSWQDIVLVLNTAYGAIEHLPFDLRGHRVLAFGLREGEEKAEVRRALQRVFEQVIRDALGRRSTVAASPTPSASDRLIDLINTSAPAASAACRAYVSSVVAELDAMNPLPYDGQDLGDVFSAALSGTSLLIADFARVSEAISLAGARSVAMEVHRGFNLILERYQLPRRFSGSFSKNQFDFYKFIGHELFTTFVAFLLDNRQWGILQDILSTPFVAPNYDGAIHYGEISQRLLTLEWMNQQLDRRWITLHGRLLEERHSSAPIGEAMPFGLFANADDFLFVRGEVETSNNNAHPAWMPWTSIHLEGPPPFLQLTRSRTYAEQLAAALGAPDVATMKQRLEERAVKLSRQFPGHSFPILGGFNTDDIAVQ